jgi:hypothetical protein
MWSDNTKHQLPNHRFTFNCVLESIFRLAQVCKSWCLVACATKFRMVASVSFSTITAGSRLCTKMCIGSHAPIPCQVTVRFVGHSTIAVPKNGTSGVCDLILGKLLAFAWCDWGNPQSELLASQTKIWIWAL